MTKGTWAFKTRDEAEQDFNGYFVDYPCQCDTATGTVCLRCQHPGNPANVFVWLGTGKEIDYSKITREVLGK